MEREDMDKIVAASEWRGYWESLINENTALRAEIAELKDAAATLYYGGLLSSEMCAKIEGYAELAEEE